jgi:quinol---cytochrome c reductase iron-sulfur subunit, bacillus type
VPTALPQEIPVATRRRFFIGAIYGLWTAIGAAFGLPALAYLLLPPKARKEDEWVEAGDIARLAPGSPVELAFRRNRVDGWKVISEKSTAWVLRRPDNSIVAFGPQCTHLGCAYHWEEKRGQFLCPCHTSLFNSDGTVASGPAARPLDRYDVKVQGTKLLVGPLRKSEES